MKVTHLIKAMGVAGAERHLMTLLPGLRALGVDARLVVLVQPHNPVPAFAPDGVPVERIVIRHHTDLGVIDRIRRHLTADPPDILHTHLIHADTFGLIAARLAGIRQIVSSRHNDDQFRRWLPIRWLNRGLWGATQHGIAISEAIRRFSVEVEGADPQKVTTIHYGMTPAPALEPASARQHLRQTLNMPSDALVLGMVCRLVEQKGVTYAIRAFAQINEAHPQTRLVIIGEGGQRAALEAEAGVLGVRGRVYFLGWHDDAAHLMAGFDLFLMPSLWEGFGLVLLEAMAQALPIIGSDVSAIPEVVAHGETGLLVPPRDPAAIAQAVDTLIKDEALRRHMGLLGQERLETVFSAARMIAATKAIYNKGRDYA